MTASRRKSTSSGTEPLMTTAQAAAFLNFPEATVKDWRRQGTGPAYIRINGANVRYRVRDLNDWLDSQTVGAA